MRLYTVLLATAAAMLASNAAADKCTIVTKAPAVTTAPTGSYDASSGSAVTQDSTAASAVDASQASNADDTNQGVTQTSGSDAPSSDDDTEQTSGSGAPSSDNASQNTDVAASSDTAGEADTGVDFTATPTATTRPYCCLQLQRLTRQL